MKPLTAETATITGIPKVEAIRNGFPDDHRDDDDRVFATDISVVVAAVRRTTCSTS
jgi:hypothetical protein